MPWLNSRIAIYSAGVLDIIASSLKLVPKVARISYLSNAWLNKIMTSFRETGKFGLR